MQNIAIKQTQNDRIWAYTTMAAVFALLFIWVVPETIALRHVLLVIAFLASVMVAYAKFACELDQLKVGRMIECWRILNL